MFGRLLDLVLGPELPNEQVELFEVALALLDVLAAVVGVPAVGVYPPDEFFEFLLLGFVGTGHEVALDMFSVVLLFFE